MTDNKKLENLVAITPESYIKDIRWAERSDKINSIARLEMLVITYTPFVPPIDFPPGSTYGGYDSHEEWVTVPNVSLSAEEWDLEK